MNKETIKFAVGEQVVFWGHGVSCDAARKRYDEGLCPAQNDERHLKVGGTFTVVAVHDASHGFYVDVQGQGVKGDNIVVSGISSSNFMKTKNNNMKITNLVKKILDTDTRKLVKAGFINGDLALTDEGTAELVALLFLEKKAELVKIAEEKLSDETH